MAVLRVTQQRIVDAFHSLEQRFEQFRRGAADRVPDFTEFRRAVAEFFAHFSWNKQKPTIAVPQPSRTPVSFRPADPSDPLLEGLERPFFKARSESVDEHVPELPAIPTTANPIEISQDTLEEVRNRIATQAKEAATEFVNTVKDAAGEAGEALERKATELVAAAKEGLSNTIDWFTGSPPPPPLPPAAATLPKLMSEERRQELETSIESQTGMHWVGRKKPEETPAALEHLQPAIIGEEPKPQREGTFFDPKAVQQPLAKQKTDIEKKPLEQSVTLTPVELKQAEILVRGAKEAADADRLKEQERQFADLPTPATMKRMQKPEPKPRPTFDPTRAKKFQDWSDPAKEDTAHPETVIEAEWPKIDKAGLAQLTAEIHELAASITASASSPEAGPTRRPLQRRAHAADLRKRETKTEKPQEKLSRSSQDAAAPPEPAPAPNSAPTRGPLRKRGRVADLRRRETQTDKTQPEDLRDKLSRLSGEAAKRQPRRNKALKQALIEGTRTSQELPARKPLQASPLERLRPVSGHPRHVRFGDLVEEREIKNSAEESNLKRRTLAQIDARTPQNDAEEILRTVHKEMRSRIVKGNRFINLMLIALDNTELPPQRQTDPDRMAIELYRAFLKKAPDRWAEQAESTIRVQLEARSREGALRALEPIVKHFDRYSRPPSENDRPGMQFLHERLGQLGKILHKLQAEQISRRPGNAPHPTG